MNTLFGSSATQQQRAFPGGPERDFRAAKFLKIKRVNALGWRQFMHALQVLIEQRMDCRAGEVVDFNVHGPSFMEKNWGGTPHFDLHRMG